MNELGQIRTAVLTALKDAGIEALEQFPEEKIKAYTSAAATVGVGAASGKSAGFGDYLGEVTVTASADDPTVCLVEFGFAVAHGLNQIYLTVHLTV